MRRLVTALALLPIAAAACSHVRQQEDDCDAAHKVFTIEGLYGPESAKYDASQEAWFISNMVGEGSAKDGEGYILKVPADYRHDIRVAGSPAER